MIWSDADILKALRDGLIRIYPPVFPGYAGPVQPASLELRVAEDVRLPGDGFQLTHTVEVVTLGRTVAAQLNGKSSWARRGLMVHSTGGWIDPGFSGQIVLELKNLRPDPLHIPRDARLCQLVFHPLLTPSNHAYGDPWLDSHYQGQRGNVPSHLETDS